MDREPIKVVADLILDAMQLNSSRVFIYNQDYKLPNDQEIFVVIQYNNSRPYSLTKTNVLLGNNIYVWDESVTYNKGNIVKYEVNDLFYRCLNFNVSTVPTDTNNWVETTDHEKQCLTLSENYTINIVSQNSDARTRKEEILFALNSQQASEAQEKHQFKIFPISGGFRNISAAEGGSMLNRFAIDIDLLTWYIRRDNISYYDNFTDQVIFET